MTSVVAFLIILLLLGFMTYAGLRDGLFFSTYALMRNILAFLFAMTFCEPLARIFCKVFTSNYPAMLYFVPLAFAIIYGAVFALGRWLKVTYTIPRIECPVYVDRIAGPIVGFTNAVVVSGTLLIAWSLFPVMRYAPNDIGYLKPRIDTGTTMLRYYSYAEKRMGGNMPFLLHDEAVNDDRNQNGRPDLFGESFSDVNGNGVWDRGWLWKYRHHADIAPMQLDPLGLPKPETED